MAVKQSCVYICLVLTFVLLHFFYLELSIFVSGREEFHGAASTSWELILEFYI